MNACSLRQNVGLGQRDQLRQIGALISKNSNSVFLSVCQVLRDISCVNPSRTPKAFKGKGSALSQRVTSGLHSVSSGCLGAGA